VAYLSATPWSVLLNRRARRIHALQGAALIAKARIGDRESWRLTAEPQNTQRKRREFSCWYDLQPLFTLSLLFKSIWKEYRRNIVTPLRFLCVPCGSAVNLQPSQSPTLFSTLLPLYPFTTLLLLYSSMCVLLQHLSYLFPSFIGQKIAPLKIYPQ